MRKKEADEIISEVQKDYNALSTSFSRTRKDPWPELRFLFRKAEHGDRVLDLGCGNGRFVRFLEDCDYMGVDFSEEMIKKARERFPERRFMVADAFSLPFKNEYFDKIYSIAVIHHIPTEEYRLRVLREAKRVLKPEGVLILTAWNIWSGNKLLDLKKMIWMVMSPPRGMRDVFLKRKKYFHFFHRKELVRLIRKAGFAVEEEGLVKKGKNSNFYLVARK